MAEALIRATVRKWGNTYGIRISKRDMERLGIREGAEVSARISTETVKPDLSMFPVFHGPDPYGSRDHDRIVGKGLERERERR